MNSTFSRAVCRVLMVCMVVAPLQASAELIGTGAVVPGVVSKLNAREARAAIAAQIEALGIDSAAARERVAAISDAEALQIAGRIESLPAGAADGVVIPLLLLVIFLIWRFGFSDQAKAEQKAREPAKEPAKK